MKQKKPINQAKDKKQLTIAIMLMGILLVIRILLISTLIIVSIAGNALDAIVDGFSDMCDYYNESYPKQDTLTWRIFDESTYSEQCSLIKTYITKTKTNIDIDDIEIISISKDNISTIPFDTANNSYNIAVKIKEEYIWITLYTDNKIEEAPTTLEWLQKAHIIAD